MRVKNNTKEFQAKYQLLRERVRGTRVRPRVENCCCMSMWRWRMGCPGRQAERQCERLSCLLFCPYFILFPSRFRFPSLLSAYTAAAAPHSSCTGQKPSFSLFLSLLLSNASLSLSLWHKTASRQTPSRCEIDISRQRPAKCRGERAARETKTTAKYEATRARDGGRNGMKNRQTRYSLWTNPLSFDCRCCCLSLPCQFH